MGVVVIWGRNHMIRRATLFILVGLLSTKALATTIDFNVPDQGLPYSEDGFTVTGGDNGIDSMNLFEFGFFPSEEISITHDGGLDFTFNSLQFASDADGRESDGFSLLGFNNGVQVASYGSDLSTTSALFQTVLGNATLIDELRIAGSGFNEESVRWDNISVTAVPLPAAAWLFISAIAGLFGVKRLRT